MGGRSRLSVSSALDWHPRLFYFLLISSSIWSSRLSSASNFFPSHEANQAKPKMMMPSPVSIVDMAKEYHQDAPKPKRNRICCFTS